MKLQLAFTEFFEAAYEYAKIMRRDHRNTHDPVRIQQDISIARGRYYDAFDKLFMLDGENIPTKIAVARKLYQDADTITERNL